MTSLLDLGVDLNHPMLRDLLINKYLGKHSLYVLYTITNHAFTQKISKKILLTLYSEYKDLTRLVGISKVLMICNMGFLCLAASLLLVLAVNY